MRPARVMGMGVCGVGLVAQDIAEPGGGVVVIIDRRFTGRGSAESFAGGKTYCRAHPLAAHVYLRPRA